MNTMQEKAKDYIKTKYTTVFIFQTKKGEKKKKNK